MNEVKKYYLALGLDKDATQDQLTAKYQSMKAQFDEIIVSGDSGESQKARENLVKLNKIYVMVGNDIKDKLSRNINSSTEVDSDEVISTPDVENQEQPPSEAKVYTEQPQPAQVDTGDKEDYKKCVHTYFNKQAVMKTFGAKLTDIQSGKITIELPFTPTLTDQNGCIHPGVVAAIADCACSCAAMALISEDSDLMTIEHKINYISPAKGDLLKAVGNVLDPGDKVKFCSGEVFAVRGGEERKVATIHATIVS